MMKSEGSLLIVDDNKNILTSLRFLLSDKFERIITLSSPVSLTTLLKAEQIDVVLLDMNFTANISSGNEGLYWLREIKRINPAIPVVLFTAYADISLAVSGIKEGAFDFIVKPWDNNVLTTILLNAYGKRGGRGVAANLCSTNNIVWGTTRAMQELKELVERIAPTSANILITGENGTGKEVVAREIHTLSSRRNKELIKVDMGAIPDSLFESELFGYAKGAFTDAKVDKPGRFEEAHESTLFLDEIGNIPLPQQAKLLTVLQQRAVTRLGSNRQIGIDTRLICATNCRLDEMVAAGQFREDLFYRINTIHIHIPPLRDRRGDIMAFANLFLDQYSTAYNKEISGFTDEAVNEIVNYPWYGNIRELQHAVEKGVIMCNNEVVDVKDIYLPRPVPNGATEKEETLENMEKQMICNALKKHNYNLSLVATKLGITRQTLYNKMKRYGL